MAQLRAVETAPKKAQSPPAWTKSGFSSVREGGLRALAAATSVAGLLFVLLAACANAQAPLPKTTVPQTAAEQKRTAWFRDAHFGLFIHWGLYSVPAGEWQGGTNYGEWMMMSTRMPASEYAQFAHEFNPTHFDPTAWVLAAKNAGMRYVVLTAKHHEGFALWDSKANPFNVVRATPFHRDVVKELGAACRKARLKFCVYYSDTDWRDPNFPAQYNPGHFHGDPSPAPDMDVYLASMKAQMRELLTNYGPLGIFWFDNGGGFAGYDMGTVMHGQELVNLVHELQPDCLVNNRAGVPGDYVTPEQEIPNDVLRAPWETCMTMNAHWGYNKNDCEWKSPAVLVHDLIDITSKGGNFLLNIGPTADGDFPPQSLYRLAQIGRWMRVNGEAIHGAGPTPFPVTHADWRCTTKPGKLYIHLLTWPGQSFTLTHVPGNVTGAYLLADPKRTSLPVTQTGGTVIVTLPARAPDPIASVLCLETKR